MTDTTLKTSCLAPHVQAKPWLMLLTAVISVISAPCARAALLFYDGFDYTTGEALGDTSSAVEWGNPKSNITIADGGLNYGGLQASTGKRVNVNGGSSNLDGARTVTDAWTSQTNGILYFSLLLRIDGTSGIATSGTGTPIVNISQAGSVSKQLISLNLLNDSGVKLGVLKYPSSSTAVSSAFFVSGAGADLVADGSTTYLVVAKYEWIDGAGNDVVTVWVNPTSLGGEEDPANKVSTSAGTDGTENAGRFYVNRGPLLNMDELRIGQTWADVTPTGAPVIEQQPQITGGMLAPEGFILRGSNGTPSGVYRVLSSTDLLAPANAWATVSTNTFDAAGHFESTNPVPAGAAQNFYRLLSGGEFPIAPLITTQPSGLAVLAGQNAPFTVVASGSSPLAFQWYFEDAPITGATASSYTVTAATTNDAGNYHVVITNSVGSVTSVVASLSVVPVPAAGVPDGYATLGAGTTGGAGGPTVTVSTFEDFEFYVDNTSGPFVVLVQGTINLGGSNVRVRDNKTILGLGTNATLVGDLKVDGNNNVILRNLNFTNPGGAGDKDGLTLQDCLNVWVDHCTFYDAADGNLDITHGADWVTVSWCRFFYTDAGADHRFSNLVGHSDNNAGEDSGKLHVTFHHNWWGALCHERMPRVRFGRIHSYNNFFNAPGNNYCIRAALDSQVLLENNYFLDVHNPWEVYVTTGTTGLVSAVNNIEIGTSFSVGDDSNTVLVPGTDEVFAPAYGYTLEPAADVPGAVTNLAGAGKGPFAP